MFFIPCGTSYWKIIWLSRIYSRVIQYSFTVLSLFAYLQASLNNACILTPYWVVNMAESESSQLLHHVNELTFWDQVSILCFNIINDLHSVQSEDERPVSKGSIMHARVRTLAMWTSDPALIKNSTNRVCLKPSSSWQAVLRSVYRYQQRLDNDSVMCCTYVLKEH